MVEVQPHAVYQACRLFFVSVKPLGELARLRGIVYKIG